MRSLISTGSLLKVMGTFFFFLGFFLLLAGAALPREGAAGEGAMGTEGGAGISSSSSSMGLWEKT